MRRRRLALGAAVLLAAAVLVGVLSYRQGTGTTARRDNSAPTRPGKSIAIAPTCSVAGTVRDAAGAPIAGAHVCAQTKDRDLQCVTTDPNGTYAIGSLFALTYEVTASAPRFRPGRHHRDGDPKRDRFVLAAGEHRTGVDVVLDAGAVEIVGTVFDVSGGPIAHARVRVAHEDFDLNTWRHWYPATETDDHGAFTLWASPGEQRIEASAEGYASVEQDALAPGRVDLLLVPGGSIAGTVVDRDGRPVADALVAADWIDEHEVARTDDTGHFEIEGLVPARFDVSARTPNAYGMAVGSVLVGLAAHVDGIIIRVDPAARITGRVITKPPSTLCPGADVQVNLHDPFGEDIEMSIASDGVLYADGVVPGTYYAEVACYGHYAEDRYPPIIVAGRDQDLSWTVTPGATLRGHVRTTDGTPVGDGWVEAHDPSGYYSDRTARDGAYELDGMKPGSYEVMAGSRQSLLSNAQVSIQSGIVARDFVVDKEARIIGVVVDPQNRPVPDVEVRADEKGHDGSVVSTRPDGTFALFTRPGTYDVYAGVDWQHPIGKKERVIASLAQTAAVRLVVPAQTGTIKGDVSDAYGRPISDAYVYAFAPSVFGFDGFQIGWNEHPTLTAPDGTFTITGLGPGTYTVAAQRRGGGSTRVLSIEPGSKVSLVIPKTASLSGTVSYTDQTHPEHMTLTVRSAPDAEDRFFREQRFYHTDGSFTLDELPSGTLTIAVTTADGLGVASVLLGAGEQRKDVAITVDHSVTITGRLVDQVTRKGAARYFVIPRTTRAQLGTTVDYMDVTHQTDANGNFSVLAPPGEVIVEVMTSDPRDRSFCAPPHRFELRGPKDVGEIPLVRSRVDNGGDVGFTLAAGTVDTVDPKGPAAAAGLRVGDVVTAIDGAGPAALVADCGFAMIAVPPGSVLALTLSRGHTIKVTVGPEPPAIDE